ncbi:helix-turn-helix transcriptional regulator [Dietzia alimentaria]|uniref:helix-turn-helix transcriptional regulator n=1 Tax=Dietzia alimentaria TaxID=665550 RepID=UPI00029A4C88|nr:helix-turn-helix transcriptional regulator [Dietzia alimentaria]
MTTANAHGHIPQIVLRHRLRIAREEAGLGVSELAERMGVARNTVGNAEAGKGVPRKVVLNAWALATGVDIEWLVTGESPHQGDPDGGDECPQPGSNRRPAD